MLVRFTFEALAVDIGLFLEQVLDDVEVALVARDHETRVTVSVCDLNVGVVFDEVLHDVVVAVEAGGPERGRVGEGGLVAPRPHLDEVLDDLEVSGGGCTPQGRGTVYGLSVKGD